MPSWVVEDVRQMEAGEDLSIVRTGSAKILLVKNLAEDDDTAIAIDAGALTRHSWTYVDLSRRER